MLEFSAGTQGLFLGNSLSRGPAHFPFSFRSKGSRGLCSWDSSLIPPFFCPRESVPFPQQPQLLQNIRPSPLLVSYSLSKESVGRAPVCVLTSLSRQLPQQQGLWILGNAVISVFIQLSDFLECVFSLSAAFGNCLPLFGHFLADVR